ncbi:MAG: heparinase II/III-family protein, partial [Saprospiraceae bacterium]|nr:heparinase II/III-family protein [Saprospiraceae bacterium]
PWAETNDISGAMTLGYLLFGDPEFGYFASDKVDQRVYWFLSNQQIKDLENIVEKPPTYGSLSFDHTGYFVMREGWGENDKMMVVSAGLDENKPDHQHADMLGIQAMAYGNVILPNYQVRYSLEDFDFFKNSMVKNVALVDDEVQGKEWTSNRGGSGFGKFGSLPNPKVLAWRSNTHFDFFAGRHDGFENIGVEHERKILFIKNHFWVLKDKFTADTPHEYKQVWQGHYTHESGPDLLRATFHDAVGFDLYQVRSTDTLQAGGARGKNWTVVSKEDRSNFSFLTVLYPYQGYNNRLDENAEVKVMNGWAVNDFDDHIEGAEPVTLSRNREVYCFDVQALSLPTTQIIFEVPTDFFVQYFDDHLILYSLEHEDRTFRLEVAEKVLFEGELSEVKQWVSLTSN